MPDIKFLLLAVVLSLCPASTAVAGDNDVTRSSLKGLQGVNVLIEELKPTVERAGLTEADIRTDVELKLRLAGITVLSDKQSLAAPGSPYLYVNVQVLDSDDSLWPCSISVALEQSVTLRRNPQIGVVAVTWSVTSVGSVGRLNVRGLRDSVKEGVDKFINAYLAANPKN
jgi:hypothetical protein